MNSRKKNSGVKRVRRFRYRECHVKGDLLLMYRIEEFSKIEVVVFVKVGTHSEMFSN